MRLFRKKVNKDRVSFSDTNRSVLFRGAKNEKKMPLRKRSIILRRFGRFAKVVRFSIFISFIFISFSLITWIMISFASDNTSVINPMAKSSSAENDDIEIKFKEYLSRSNVLFSDVKQDDGSTYKIILIDKTEVLVTSTKDISTQIASLQFIYNRLTMEGRLIRRLDLRYEKPVITLK